MLGDMPAALIALELSEDAAERRVDRDGSAGLKQIGFRRAQAEDAA
jgi:hypothetical protein